MVSCYITPTMQHAAFNSAEMIKKMGTPIFDLWSLISELHLWEIHYFGPDNNRNDKEKYSAENDWAKNIERSRSLIVDL